MPDGVGIGPEERQALLEALRLIARSCDGARAKDHVGFNGFDAHVGKRLAAVQALSYRQAVLAKAILKKYRKQLGDEAYTSIYGEGKA